MQSELRVSGGKKTVLYLQGESKDEQAEQRGISVYSSPDSVFVSVAGSRFLLLSSHLAWKKILDLFSDFLLLLIGKPLELLPYSAKR